MKLRLKPPTLQGEQYHSDLSKMSDEFRNLVCNTWCPTDPPGGGVPHIHLGGGIAALEGGDWIIQTPEGILSICRADDFEATYEKVTE